MNTLIDSLPLLLAGCALGASCGWLVSNRLGRRRIDALRTRHQHVQQASTQAMQQARRQIGQLQEQITALQQQVSVARRREQAAEQRDAARAQAVAHAHAALLATTPSLRDGFSETVATLPPDGFADTLPAGPGLQMRRR